MMRRRRRQRQTKKAKSNDVQCISLGERERSRKRWQKCQPKQEERKKRDAKLRCQTEIAPTATASSLEDRQAPSAAVRAITGSFYFGSVRLGSAWIGAEESSKRELMLRVHTPQRQQSIPSLPAHLLTQQNI